MNLGRHHRICGKRARHAAAAGLVLLSILLGCRDAFSAEPALELRAAHLRCEYAVDPLDSDVRKPRFGWQLQSSARSEKQTAYQILVASSPELLAQNKGDKWDSGRVESDNSTHVVYGGSPLRSREQCVWKVRVWNRTNEPGAFSRPARFEMGLLERDDWEAK